MLAPTSYVSPTLLCKSHHPMLVPPSNVSHNGTNWNDTHTHKQIAFYILIVKWNEDMTSDNKSEQTEENSILTLFVA